MIDGKFQALCPGQCVLQLFLNVFLIVRELPAQMGSDLFRFLPIGNQVDPSKDNNAADIQRPFAFLPVSGVIDAIADAVVFCDCANGRRA